MIGSLLLPERIVADDDPVQWGNPYFMGGAGSVVVSDTRTGFARFTATEDMVVNGAQLYANFASSPDLVVSIQADDGTGFPDGTPLASTTITPGAAGWHTATFATPTSTLTSGNTYFLVASTTTDGASFGWRFNNVTGGHPNIIQPFGVADSNWARGQTTPSADVTPGQSVMYLLDTNIGRAVGQPYLSIPTQNLGSTVTTQGQRFRFDASAAQGNSIATSVNLRLNIGATPPSEPLEAVLLDSALNSLGGGLLDLSGEPQGQNIFTLDFNSQIALLDNEIYYLGLFSDGSAASSVQWYGMSHGDNVFERSASFQGPDGYAVAWDAQSDFGAATMTTDLNRNYYFEFVLIPEPSGIVLVLAGSILLFKRRFSRVS